MENKELYYSVNANSSGEVYGAYLYAKAHNIKYYRAVSKSGKFFGWVDGTHVEATSGQEWFENSFYIEPEQLEDLDAMPEPDLQRDITVATIEITGDTRINDKSITDDAEKIDELKKLATSAPAGAAESERAAESEKKLADLKQALSVIFSFINEV